MPLRPESRNSFRLPVPEVVEEVLLRLLETREEQDRRLLENRETINSKVRRGIDQLDRGEGILEDQLDAHLAKLKSQT
jgi:hypothetical protein